MADRPTKRTAAVGPAPLSPTTKAASQEVAMPPPKAGAGAEPEAAAGLGALLTKWQLIRIAFTWMGTSAATDFLFFEAMPSQVRATVGDEHKGWALSMVVLASAVVTLIAGPLIGIYSDRTTWALGRRRPYIMVGGLVTFLAMLFVAASNSNLPPDIIELSAENCSDIEAARANGTFAPDELELVRPFQTHGSLLAYVFLHMVLSLGIALIEIPFNGLIADKVPANSRGLASSVVGVMAIVGAIVGMVAGLFYRELGVFGSFSLIAGFLWLCTMVGSSVPEQRLESPSPSSSPSTPAPRLDLLSACCAFVKPFKDSDFRWLFLTRFLVMMGVSTMGSFLQYWLYEVVDLPPEVSPERGVAILVISLTVTGLPCSFFAGILSDRLGGQRKIFVFAAGILLTAASASFTFLEDYFIIVAFTVVAGVGFGVYLAVDYALALDVLAHSDTFALDLAVWHQAEVIPRLLATPIAALVLEEFHRLEGCAHDRQVGIGCGQRCTLGWVVLWCVVALYFLAATVLVYKIKRAK